MIFLCRSKLQYSYIMNANILRLFNTDFTKKYTAVKNIQYQVKVIFYFIGKNKDVLFRHI